MLQSVLVFVPATELCATFEAEPQRGITVDIVRRFQRLVDITAVAGRLLLVRTLAARPSAPLLVAFDLFAYRVQVDGLLYVRAHLAAVHFGGE